MVSSRHLGLLLFTLVAVPVAVACSADAESKTNAANLNDIACKKNQTSRCLCGLEEGFATCGDDLTLNACDCSEARESKEKGGTTRPVGTPDTPGPESSGPDAAVAVAPLCVLLAPCCEALKRAGFTGSESQCKRVVAENSDTSCGLVHETYRTPDETDFVCP